MGKKKFIINAYPQSGKTTFENMVAKYIPTYITSIINEVITLTDDLYGKSKKNEKRRNLLSYNKNFLKEYYNIPYLLTSAKVDLFQQSDKQIMLIDVREPEDIKYLVKTFGFTTVFINNNRHTTANNIDDNSVENYDYDIYIDNNGSLNDLEEKAIIFVETYCK